MKNLLRLAHTLIRRVAFEYRIAGVTKTNEFGQRVSEYGDWTMTRGMVESGLVSSFGSKNLAEISYKDLGLDPSRRTITVWLEASDISTSAGRKTCDQVRVGGKIYNILRLEDWLGYDGWKRAYCQEVLETEQGA